ncbi:MAG: DAK2 domain-containing protein [Bacillota bacterium]
MRFESFSGKDLFMMLVGSANLLAEKRSEIDSLNVFPVPDGDTGTNMHLTLFAGVKEAGEKRGQSAGEIASALARGCLLGARGNSGVILSQILQGFAGAMEGKDKVLTADVAKGFREGTQAAYRAVMNPAEGTILTVCRRFSEAFEEGIGRNYDMLRAMLHAYRQAQQALEETPELLPVLKEAGVVDAGGRGLVVILEGILRALKMAAARQELELFDLAASQQKEFITRAREVAAIEYTYCTEMIIRGAGLLPDQIRRELIPYGDCVMVVGNNETAKVHIHSNHPGLVIECCLKYGALHNIQVNNMEDQHMEFSAPKGQQKPLGVISVGLGEGIISIMESLGVDVVISGGQTMNPSTESILDAINGIGAEKVLILPNNSNVIMAVEQAAGMAGKKVRIVRTVNIPQGLAAMLVYNPYGEMDDIAEKMERAACGVKCGEITRAVRDTKCDGQKIVAGEYIGVAGDRIVVSGPDLFTVAKGLLDTLLEDEAEIVTFYYGAEMTGHEAESLVEKLTAGLGGLDSEVHFGGQPHYQFLISVE